MTGGKILWAQDADGEIGKRPHEPELVWISGEGWAAAVRHNDTYARLDKRRTR